MLLQPDLKIVMGETLGMLRWGGCLVSFIGSHSKPIRQQWHSQPRFGTLRGARLRLFVYGCL